MEGKKNKPRRKIRLELAVCAGGFREHFLFKYTVRGTLRLFLLNSVVLTVTGRMYLLWYLTVLQKMVPCLLGHFHTKKGLFACVN